MLCCYENLKRIGNRGFGKCECFLISKHEREMIPLNSESKSPFPQPSLTLLPCRAKCTVFMPSGHFVHQHHHSDIHASPLHGHATGNKSNKPRE